MRYTFKLDHYPDYDISPADPTVIYIGMGTEGVLVGPNLDNPGPNPRTWKISHKGIDALEPLSWTITNPQTVFRVIAQFLFVPPFFLIYLWALAQVYRYAFQPGEKVAPYKLAAYVAGISTLFAGVALYIWLTDVNTDQAPLLGIIAFCIVLAVCAGIWISRKRGFSTLFVRRMAWASAMVGAIIAVSMSCVWLLCPVLIVGGSAFASYRHAVEHWTEKQGVFATRRELDRAGVRFAVMAIGMVLCGALAFGLGVVLVQNFFSLVRISTGTYFIVALLFLCLPVGTALYRSMEHKTLHSVGKKKNTNMTDEPLFTGRRWYRSLLAHTAAWMILGLGSAYAVLMLQSQAQGWFQTLLINGHR